jgi:uncharacterized membrane protein
MKQIVLLATGTLLSSSIAAFAQQDGPWRMHDGMGWGWGGMWLGPLVMLAALALFVAIVVFLVRWVGGDRAAPRTVRDLRSSRPMNGALPIWNERSWSSSKSCKRTPSPSAALHSSLNSPSASSKTRMNYGFLTA